MALKVRRAVRNDRDVLVSWNIAMARETEDRELSLQLVRAGVDAVFDSPTHGFYVVAESAGEIAGSLMVTSEWSDWRNAHFWWIQSVYVAPSQRRRGVYRGLHAFVVEAARSAGACGIRLYVEKQNRRAQSAYETLGMHETHYRMLEIEL